MVVRVHSIFVPIFTSRFKSTHNNDYCYIKNERYRKIDVRKRTQFNSMLNIQNSAR